MNSHAKEETNQDLILREQNDEKTNSRETEAIAESGDCDSPNYVPREHRNQWEQSSRDCVSTIITISLR